MSKVIDYDEIARLRAEDQAQAIKAHTEHVVAIAKVQQQIEDLQDRLTHLRISQTDILDGMSVLWLKETEERRELYIREFRSRIEVRGECHEWTGRRSPAGYGNFHILGGSYGAHRFSWMIANGPIPAGLVICHACDNPPCVRPEHLWLGTLEDNTADCMAKGRFRLGEHWKQEPAGFVRSGEQSPWAKLSDAEVAEIRAFYHRYHPKQAWLARKYGVSRATINGIVRGMRRRERQQ